MALMQRKAHRYTQAQMFHKTKYRYQALTCQCECPLMHMSAQLYVSMTVPMYHTCARVRKGVYTQVPCQHSWIHSICMPVTTSVTTHISHVCTVSTHICSIDALPYLPTLDCLTAPKCMPIRIHMQLSVHADASCALADHVLPCLHRVSFPGNLEPC